MASTNCPDCHKPGAYKGKDIFVCVDCGTLWSYPGWEKLQRMLQQGDIGLGELIKHPVHGVARFGGKVQSRFPGESAKDYVVLEYLDGRVQVPIEQTGKLRLAPLAAVSKFCTLPIKRKRFGE